jgi:hypothetical protein
MPKRGEMITCEECTWCKLVPVKLFACYICCLAFENFKMKEFREAFLQKYDKREFTTWVDSDVTTFRAG